jgi:hypothetical protein
VIKLIQIEGIVLPIRLRNSLKNEDQEFILEILKIYPKAIAFCNPIFREDSAFMLKAISKNKEVFQYVSVKLKTNPVFLLEAVKTDGLFLQYIQDDCQSEEIAEAAVQQNQAAKQYVLQMHQVKFNTLVS